MNASSKNFERSDFDTHFSLGLRRWKFSLFGVPSFETLKKNMIQSSKPNSSFQKFLLSMSKNDGFLSFLEAKFAKKMRPTNLVPLVAVSHGWYLNIPSQVRSVGTAICALMVRSRCSRGKKGVWVVEPVEVFFFPKLPIFFLACQQKGF